DDDLSFASEKWFTTSGPLVRFLHGIGVSGWPDEGLFGQTVLIHARLNGISYGQSTIVTSAELLEPPESREFTADVFPNPFAEQLTIALNGPVREVPEGPIRFEIFDLLGRQVQSGEVASQRNAISTAE